MGNIIRLQSFSEKVAGVYFHQVLQGKDAFFGGGIKSSPVPDVLFRPEEIHGAYGMWQPCQPSGEGGGHIRHDAIRSGGYHLSVLHLHLKRRTTIKTRSFDLHQFSGKEPANCQRLEASLGEPFLLTMNGDAILGGKVAEGRKAADIVGIRE